MWAKTNEELVKVQIFYTTIRKDLIDLEVVADSLITVHKEVLNFDWSNDTAYNEWKNKFDSIEQMVEYDEDNNARITITFVVNDEDKEDP